jgi:hypothetical protein
MLGRKNWIASGGGNPSEAHIGRQCCAAATENHLCASLPQAWGKPAASAGPQNPAAGRAAARATTGGFMQGYAVFFATSAIFSLLFVDSSVQSDIKKIGRVCLAVSVTLFVITEIISLFV